MRLMLMFALAAGLSGSPLASQVASAPAGQAAKSPFVKAEAETVIRELATQLEANFVFPDAAKAYAAMLRSKLASGAYASFPDGETFAETVTKDLQTVHKDGHLHLIPPTKNVNGQTRGRRVRSVESAISKAGWLADGIAYIRFEGFPGNEATMTALKQFLETHKDAKTLIIDARSHHGGGLAEMNLMFPQLFAQPTVLVAMDTRIAAEQGAANADTDGNVRKIASPEGVVRREHYVEPAAQQGALAKAKVYLLTSNRTASAAEHLSLSLKRTHRATLIGETTRGAGHYGGFVPLGSGYTAFIPVGRTFDPDNNQGWEALGVKPDVAVPADKALDEALKLAGVGVSGEAALAALK